MISISVASKDLQKEIEFIQRLKRNGNVALEKETVTINTLPSRGGYCFFMRSLGEEFIRNPAKEGYFFKKLCSAMMNKI